MRPPTALPASAGAHRPSTPRLERLRQRPRQPGQASFFWYDAQFRSEAVKVLPGEYFVDREDLMIMTTLGSCIAACLWDRRARVGGLNHFLLPEGSGDSGRYGAYAMELLINELIKCGATRSTLEAKVFGGGRIIGGLETMAIGERNTRFVLDYLATEHIPVVSKDVLDVYPRKVCFLPASGKAMVKRLSSTAAEQLATEERAVRRLAPVASTGGSIELF